MASGCECPKSFPVCVCGKKPVVKLINKKPIEADKKELNDMRQKAKKSTKLTKIISKYL